LQNAPPLEMPCRNRRFAPVTHPVPRGYSASRYSAVMAPCVQRARTCSLEWRSSSGWMQPA